MLELVWLQNDIYQVVEIDNNGRQTTWFQGTLADAKAYMELRNG
jgi:hypothetical protein